MATLAEIIARSYRECGYVLFLDNCPFAFTNRSELAGTGWIGDDNGVRTVYEGLEFPENFTLRTSPESGMLENGDGMTFTIQDFDNVVINYMKYVEDPDTVGGRLSPRDDPAPASLIGLGGDSVDVWGRYLNGEALGEAGQRNIYQLFPGDPMPGLDHAAYDGTELTIAPSNVYDSPASLDGRRVALYRIYKDVEQGFWPSWDLQNDTGMSRVWFGTITAATAEAKTWKFQCDGPSSWLRRPLNRNRPPEWVPVTVQPRSFSANRFALEFRYYYGTGALYGASSIFTASDEFSGPVTALDIIATVNSRIQAVAGTAGPDITYSTELNAKAQLSQDVGQSVMRVRIDENGSDAAAKAAQWTLTMDERYWEMLGFDVKAQFPTDYTDNLQIPFYPQSEDGIAAGMFSQPAIPAEYNGRQITAVISSFAYGFSTIFEAGGAADNGGSWRSYKALSKFGGMGLYATGADSAPQELLGGLGKGYYLEGQTKRALKAEHIFSDGGGTADTTGYFALKGTFTPAGGEPSTRIEIAKLAWRDDETTIGLDDNGYQRLVVEEFIDPQWFGMRNVKTKQQPDGAWLVPNSKTSWAVNDLEICPIAIVGYRDSYYGDRADLLLLSTMLSTGTSYWTGYEGVATNVRTIGANNHPDAIYDTGSDIEIADLGLGIYHDLIDWRSFVKTSKKLPVGGEDSALNRCKFAFLGGFDSQELIARILAPRAWSMGFSGGKFKLFSRPDILDFEDADASIGPDDLVETSPGEVAIESVNLTPLTPKDTFTVSFGEPLISEASPEEDIEPFACTAQDPASRTRHSNADHGIDGFGLIPYTLWHGKNPQSSWGIAWKKLWGQTMARFYGLPYLQVAGIKVHHSLGSQLGPGSIVRFQGDFGPSREGVYRLTDKIGRVQSAKPNLNDLTVNLEILLQPGSSTTLRRWAPIAKVRDDVYSVEEMHDVATRTFYCYQDAFGNADPTLHDVAWFEKPAWATGSEATVYGWQWNGRSFTPTFSFNVENVSTSGNSITYTGDSFSGTWHEGMETYLVLAPYDDQSFGSWTRSIFSVLTDSDFKFGGSDTKGFKLVS